MRIGVGVPAHPQLADQFEAGHAGHRLVGDDHGEAFAAGGEVIEEFLGAVVGAGRKAVFFQTAAGDHGNGSLVVDEGDALALAGDGDGFDGFGGGREGGDGRQQDLKRSAPVGRGVHVDRAAVGEDDAEDDGEPRPVPSLELLVVKNGSNMRATTVGVIPCRYRRR